MTTNNNLMLDQHISKPLEMTKFVLIGKQIIIVCLWIFFVANQFPHTTTIKEAAYYISLLVFIALFCSRKIAINRISPLIPPALAFIITVAVGSFWAINVENTQHDLYAHLIRYVILWIIMVNILEKRRDVELLITLIVAATTIFCLYSFIDQYIVRKISMHTRFLSGAQEITTNLLGIHTIFAINLAIYKLKSLKNIPAKVGLSFAIIILLIASFATQTRSTLLALVLSILIIFIMSRKWLKLLVILTALGITAFYTPVGKRLSSNITSNIRIQQVYLCLEIIKDHPLTGIGYGMQTFGKNLDLAAYNRKIKREYPAKKFTDTILANPHDLFTDILVRTGIIGFIMFIWLIVETYRSLLRTIWRKEKYNSDLALSDIASLSSFLLIGLFEPVFSHPFETTLCLILAFAQLLLKGDGTSQRTKG